MSILSYYIAILLWKGDENINSYLHQLHTLSDPYAPLNVEASALLPGRVGFPLHWHENLEILHIRHGKAQAIIDVGVTIAEPGQLLVINTSTLHDLKAVDQPLEYDCIIVDKAFCTQNQLELDNLVLPALVRDPALSIMAGSMTAEFRSKGPYCKTAARAELLRLLVALCRLDAGDCANHDSRLHRKLGLVRSALSYIRQNFMQPISFEQLCASTGVSKYYLCHAFKEVTGKTVVEYVNYMRCSHAKKLLCSGRYNVVEAMGRSGFSDPSYFSQVYKRQMGTPPSKDMKAAYPHNWSGKEK